MDTPPKPTLIVGVLNLTPDSFSDGGRFQGAGQAIDAGLAMAAAGADWIDVGGESTRPGAEPVAEEEEKARVLPVVRGLRERFAGRARISIDTYKAGTAAAAIEAGASVVNDVSGGLLDPELLDVVARAGGRGGGTAGVAVVLGHVRGRPKTMMEGIAFSDVVAEVTEELAGRVRAARAAGCTEIWVDPGIGFGKTTAQNLALLAGLPLLARALGVPIMVGVSLKRFIGDLTGRPVGERAFGTAGAAAAAILGGARAVRVHDVPAMRDVVRVADAIVAARALRG